MNNFAAIISALLAAQSGGVDRITTLTNTPPDPAEYLFLSVLPIRQSDDYRATSNAMRIVSTMAGMVGMDSPYPTGSAIQYSDFSEQTVKLAIATGLNERQIREIQGLIRLAGTGEANGQSPDDILTNSLLNLYRKGVVQALDDTSEYLRAQALSTGALNWTFNGKVLAVDYGVPTANKRVLTGTDGFGGSTSKFWDTVRWGRKQVKSVRAFVLSDDSLEMVLANDVNKITVVNDNESVGKNIRIVTVRRAVRNAEGITVGFDQDARSTVTLVSYRRQAQIIAPGAANGTTGVQLFPNGVMSVIGNNTSDDILTNDGSAQASNNLGYTQVSPTVEGGGRIGRWGRTYTPEGAPWSARAEGVSNELPVIETPEKLALATFPMV